MGDSDRLDDVLRYAILVAAEADDFRARALGPIHLLKYVYLADWHHALRAGDSFTGHKWTFYHFGPWSLPVQQRIEPLMRELRARTAQYQGAEGVATRFSVEPDSERLRQVEKRIPSQVWIPLKRYINRYGSDTGSLLHFVYQTDPMRHAKPNDVLDLTYGPKKAPAPPLAPEVSKKAKKRQQARIDGAKGRIRELLAQKRRQPPAEPDPPIPYDDVFFEGQQWLDSLAGEPPEDFEGELVVDPSVWEEPRGGEIP